MNVLTKVSAAVLLPLSVSFQASETAVSGTKGQNLLTPDGLEVGWLTCTVKPFSCWVVREGGEGARGGGKSQAGSKSSGHKSSHDGEQGGAIVAIETPSTPLME
jgi:hypothetical protein